MVIQYKNVRCVASCWSLSEDQEKVNARGNNGLENVRAAFGLAALAKSVGRTDSVGLSFIFINRNEYIYSSYFMCFEKVVVLARRDV